MISEVQKRIYILEKRKQIFLIDQENKQAEQEVYESNLWLVSREFTNKIVLSTYISLKNSLVAATGRQKRWTPG